MTTYNVDFVKASDYDDVRYEKKVGDILIASLDYTLQIDGELTYNEKDNQFEGLKGELVDVERKVLPVPPSASYIFGSGDNEENLTGSFVFEPNATEFKNGVIKFTLDDSVKYDGIDLSLESPISFGIDCKFNESSFDGSITDLTENFELADENESIKVTGTVSLTGNVITGMTVGVSNINIQRGENFVSYTNDGNYRIARLKELTNGDNLFRNQTIESFGATMPNITSARNMFRGCSTLTNFASNMPKLKNASNMFNGCSNLTTFSGMLTNLNKATNMFKGCSLDKQSVKNIINQLINGEGKGENAIEVITIGVNCTEYNPYEPDTEEYKEFMKFMDYLNKNEYITSVSGQ
jgi:hypothetical protein